MKLAIVSDLHLGDPASSMVQPNGAGGFKLGPKYAEFRDAAGLDNDFLILLGDIFDFSIASYADAYEAGKVFLQAVLADGITEQAIYVPGNHDFGFWHIAMHEFNVINKIKAGQAPVTRWTIPAVIDDREPAGPGSAPGFSLPYVSKKPAAAGGPLYGGLFLDNIAPGLTFNVAYPNIFLVTRKGESILLTHGHYLQPYWSFMGEFVKRIAPEEVGGGSPLDMESLVSINFPLNELASSGIGQAGPLTKLALKIEHEVKAHDLRRVKKYVDRIEAYVDSLTKFSWLKEWAADKMVGALKKPLLDALGSIEGARYDRDFTDKPDVRERFKAFYIASLMEANLLNRSYGQSIPHPSSFVFGHTHEPLEWGIKNGPKQFFDATGETVYLYNTGGWVVPPGVTLTPGQKVGGGVFKYESAAGMSSEVF